MHVVKIQGFLGSFQADNSPETIRKKPYICAVLCDFQSPLLYRISLDPLRQAGAVLSLTPFFTFLQKPEVQRGHVIFQAHKDGGFQIQSQASQP